MKVEPLWKFFRVWMEDYKYFFKNEPFLVEETE